MATVYLAHDPMIDRKVAVKVLPEELNQTDAFRIRFEREAKIIAALENPAIVSIYDFGEEHGQPYIVMRYMAGGSLFDKMNTHKILTFSDTVRIFERLAIALDEAHSNGIVHRDLKPANILFSNRDHAYLTDFGIAKLAASQQDLTQDSIVGTPAYMSPEQALGEEFIDHRSDIYSLGLIIFELLTGRSAFEAATPIQQIMLRINEAPPNILEISPLLPPGLDEVVFTVLAPSPKERYSSVQELADILAKLERSYGEASNLPANVLITTEIDPILFPTLKHSDGTEFALDREIITIGRGDNRDINLSAWDTKRYVSKLHAELYFDGTNWLIVPSETARNGTRLNGKKLSLNEEVKLSDGDQIQFAKVKLTFGF